MPRLANRLSAKFIANAKDRGMYPDGNGLYLSISAGGSKSWVFRYKYVGRRHDMGLGSYSVVPLSKARELAHRCREQLADGLNPLEVRRELNRNRKAETGLTFREASDAYIKAHETSWRNAKHKAQWKNTLQSYAHPYFGSKPIANLATDDVLRAIERIWYDKTETASRVRSRIAAVIDWAIAAGLRKGDNPAVWNGRLDKLLPAPSKIKTVRHMPSLPWQEVPAFIRQLRLQPGNGARALEFAILTGARSGEVRGATWEEIDLNCEKPVWTIPAERMKAGTEHRVPLSPQAVSLLESLPEEGGLVFVGSKQAAPLSDATMRAVLKRMQVSVTQHGFRSSLRMWVAEATEYPRELAEHTLAHKIPDPVERAYMRGDYLDKRRQLMNEWANFCYGEVPS